MMMDSNLRYFANQPALRDGYGVPGTRHSKVSYDILSKRAQAVLIKVTFRVKFKPKIKIKLLHIFWLTGGHKQRGMKLRDSSIFL